MRRITVYIVFFLLLLVFLSYIVFTGSKLSKTRVPVAEKGVLDLTRWDFSNKKQILLNGEWEYYEGQFLSPEQIIKFENKTFQSIDGLFAPKEFGTYHLTVLSPVKQTLGFIVESSSTTIFRFWINDQLVYQQGDFSKKIGTNSSRAKRLFNVFSENGEVTITYQAIYSSRTLVVDSYYNIIEFYSKQTDIQIVILTILILMSIYHFCLFFFRRKDSSTLYFALFCISVFVLQILSNYENGLSDGTINKYIFWLINRIGNQLYTILWNVSVVSCLLTYFLFLKHIFKNVVTKKMQTYFNIFIYIMFLIIILNEVLPLWIDTLTIFNVCALILATYSLFVMIKSVLNKLEDSTLILIGTSIIFIFAVVDILSSQQIIYVDKVIGYGVAIFVMFQSVVIAKRFSYSFDKVEHLSINLQKLNTEIDDLNKDLEKKVELRTEELEKARDALWGEMQIARKIQQVLLPTKPRIKGYEICAHMTPATEVGGDYYDIINVEGMDWIVIGDVSGHGVPAGLIMMMVQTAINVTLEKHPDLLPSELLRVINRTISHNIKQLNEDKYMTITVLAAHKDGIFTFSGLHQDIIIHRNATNSIEVVETKGIWIGLLDNIDELLSDDELILDMNDTMILFTDGITEARMKEASENVNYYCETLFGNDKLKQVIQSSIKSNPEKIKNHILDALEEYDREDDVTIVIIKRVK